MTKSKRFLHDFEVGESFTGFFVLRQKELRSRRDGIPYLMLEFGDRSGRMRGNVWDDAERLYRELEEGGIVKLRGMIETYQGAPQISIKQLRTVKEEDSYDQDDFLPKSDIDPQLALDRILRYTSNFKNCHLKALIDSFLTDPEFLKGFLRAPGGKLWHHNRIGGLIEHTLSVCRICSILGRKYRDVDRELLITGAILHDIGKIQEYCYDTAIDYTDRGRLVGHIVLGAQWVSERAVKLDEFPPDLLDRAVHLVLSHQGEYGSPVLPSTREGFILHYVDQIDSKMDALHRISEGMPKGERWEYVRLLERHLDLGTGDDSITDD